MSGTNPIFSLEEPPVSPSGLQSGDNTLNTLCSLRAAQALVSGHFADLSQPDARGAVLSDYVRFMTTPASHSDTYAESCHRSFFSDWQDSRPTSPRQVNQTHPCRKTPLRMPPSSSLYLKKKTASACSLQILEFAEKRSRQKLSSAFADSQLNAIGCLPMVLPFVLLSAAANEDQAVGDGLSC